MTEVRLPTQNPKVEPVENWRYRRRLRSSNLYEKGDARMRLCPTVGLANYERCPSLGTLVYVSLQVLQCYASFPFSSAFPSDSFHR
jgi:hypothetical protein